MLQRTESYQSDETLTKNCDLINKLTDVVITYDFDDCTETVDRDMIKNWLTTDENGLYTLDKKQIEHISVNWRLNMIRLEQREHLIHMMVVRLLSAEGIMAGRSIRKRS